MVESDRLQSHIPHAARIYDYWLGGKDNFEVDRAVGDQMLQVGGEMMRRSPLANRRFLARVGRCLAGELGFKQFLDIGTGLPTRPNLHETVQEITPDANVVYVDNDALVLVHARALLQKAPQATGTVDYLDADMRNLDELFTSAQVRILDLAQPVAVTMLAILQLVDDDTAHHVITSVMDRVAPGSALALSVVVKDSAPAEVEHTVRVANDNKVPVRARTSGELTALFDGLELLNPGVVPVSEWRPDEAEAEFAGIPMGMWGGLAVKPG